MTKCFFNVMVGVLFSVGVCFASPSIDKILPTENVDYSFTLTGAGFGNKVPAAPILWDNFDDGVHGAALPTTGKWTAMSGDGGLFSDVVSDRHSTDGTPYSGSLAAYNRITSDASEHSGNPQARGWYTSYYILNPTDTLYYSYQYRVEAVSNDMDGRIINKQARINTNPHPVDPDSYNYGSDGTSAIYGNNPLGSYWNQSMSVHTADGTIATNMNQNVNPAPYKNVLDTSTWHRHELYKVLSTSGADDGEQWFAFDQYRPFHRANLQTRWTGETFQMTSALLGLMAAGMIDGQGTDMRVWVDDVYIDNTQARVELCDAATWATVTHCEPQIPTAWSDSSVTVTLNIGSFSAGDAVYPYLIDANGDVSGGYVGLKVGGLGRLLFPVYLYE